MGKYLEFNSGTTGEYLVTDNDLINYYTYPSGNTSTTIMMWVYPIGDGVILGERAKFSYPDTNFDFGSNLEYNNNNMYFGFWDGTTIAGTSAAITPSKWTHLTLTYNQVTSDMFGYINGVSACTSNFVRDLPDNFGNPQLYYFFGASVIPNLASGGDSHMRLGNFKLFNYTLDTNEVEYEYLNTFEDWVCPVVYYNTENPQSYPGTGNGDLLDDVEGHTQLVLTGNTGLPTSATSLCNTYITFSGGDNQYGVTNTNIKSYFNNNDISIFMWVNTESGYNGNILTLLGQYAIETGYFRSAIEFTGNTFYIGLYDGSVIQYVSSNNDKNTETWYYVGFTNNGRTNDFIAYIDGVSIGTLNFNWNPPSDYYYAIAAGCGQNIATNSYWNGDIGTFQIWNQVLTPANVLNNYLKSVNNWVCPIINYDISNTSSYPGVGTGDTVYDLSVNSDGLLSSGVTSGTTLCFTYLQFSSSTSDYLVTQSDVASLLNTNNDESIFMWVNVKSDGVILSELGQATINTGFHYSQIEMFGGTISINILDTNPTLNTYSLGATDYNNWNYIGFTWDNNSTQVIGYLNGVSAFTTTVTRDFSWTSNGLYFGIAAEDSTFAADGGYCDLDLGTFQLFGQTLTPEKVLNNYNTSFSKWVCPVIKYNTNNYLSYTGGTEFFDLSGNGLDAALNGSPTSGTSNCFTYVEFLSSSSQSFVANDSNSYFPSNVFSLFMWVYPQSDGVMIGYDDTGTRYSIIELFGETFVFGLYNGATFDYFSASTPSYYNNWYNVGVTFDGTTLKGYLNGDFTGSISSTWTIPAQLQFTNKGTTVSINTNQYPNCRIGTFEVWNKVLPYNVIYENYINTIDDVTNNC